jgi:hypothetical protein
MKNIKLVICLFAYLLILAFVAPAARAQSPTPANYDVTVSPVFFDLTANPGDSLSNKIRFRNNTTSPLPIKITVEKMTGDVNGDLTLREDNSDQSLSWVKFSQQTFVANPLEWTDVPFTIDIPKDAAYGYYFAVSFTQDNNSPIKRTGATITGAAAVPILLDVKKAGAKINGRLISVTSDAGFYEYPPIKFSAIFENTGNVHIRPSGNVFIKDWLGRQVAVLDLNPNQAAVLPDVKKSFEATWDDGFITVEPKMEAGQPKLDKNGKPETSLNFHFDKILDLRIGRYTATALVVLSTATKDIPFEMQTSFWIFPWKVVLGAMLIIAFAGIGFYSTLRNFVRRVLTVFGLTKKAE